MALNKIWVFAEAADGKVTPITLELLAKARELGDTVEAVYAGGDADAVAGDARRPRRHQGLRHRRPRRRAAGRAGGRGHRRRRSRPATAPTSSCSAPPTTAATSPAACRSSSTSRCSPTTSTSRSTATRSSSPSRSSAAPQLVKTKFTAGGPHIVLVPPEVVRGRGVRRRRRRGRRRSRSPTSARPARPRSSTATSRRPPGPKLDEAAIVVSGGRGLGEAGKYEMIEELAKLLKGAPGCVPGHRRRRLGALLATRSARPARS